MADYKEPARSVSRNAAPTAAYYLVRRLRKVKGEAAELRASLGELQPWRLRSSAVGGRDVDDGERRPLERWLRLDGDRME